MADIYFPDVGNALVAGSTARLARDQRNYLAADRAAEQADAPHITAALQGDRTALDRVSPKTALKLAPYLQQMDAGQRTKAKDAAEFTARASNAILQADPAERPAVYAQLLADGTARGFDLSKLPPQYTPELEPKLRSWRMMSDQFLKEDGGVTYAAPAGGATPAGAIGGIESGGKYDAVGPVANAQGHRAYGKYQVLEPNVGPWTQEVLGKQMTPQEFLANPQAQDAVFQAKFGQYQAKFGPEGAARAWFAGEGGMNNPNAKDVLGTTVAGYGQRFAQATGGAAPPGVAQGDGGPPGSPAGAGGPQGAPISIEQFRGVQLPPGYRIAKKRGAIFSPVPGYVQVMPPDGGEPVLWPVPKPKEQGAGPFAGNAVEAQALNMLVANGTLTQQQAAELAAGKTITNPADGSIIFMTPSGLFSRPSGAAPQGGQPAPQAPSVTVQAGQPGAPAPGGIQVTPAKKDPAFKKLETEVVAVNSAIDNFNKVLKEAGGGSFNAFINNPQSPEAQTVLGAFNALKTALRSEAFVNTGVLQPAEMAMIDDMLLAPTSIRGLFATPEAYAAMLGQIKQFVAAKMAAARGAYGQPDAAAPAAPADLKKKYRLE